MRQLTMGNTGCLAGLLVLSLVLPLMFSWYAPRDPSVRRSGLWIVWFGQSLLCAAGLWVLLSEVAPGLALGLGALSCVGCAFVLRTRLRGVSADSAF